MSHVNSGVPVWSLATSTLLEFHFHFGEILNYCKNRAIIAKSINYDSLNFVVADYLLNVENFGRILASVVVLTPDFSPAISTIGTSKG